MFSLKDIYKMPESFLEKIFKVEEEELIKYCVQHLNDKYFSYRKFLKIYDHIVKKKFRL